jgi:glutathione S-transferase
MYGAVITSWCRNRTVGLAYGRLPGAKAYVSTAFDDCKAEYADTLKENLAKYSVFLGENKWFAGGNSATACDFVMYELLDQNSLMIPGSLEEFPLLQAYCKNVAALPAISTYLASDRNIVYPCNNQHSHTTLHKLC